jgi:hypothetical protein
MLTAISVTLYRNITPVNYILIAIAPMVLLSLQILRPCVYCLEMSTCRKLKITILGCCSGRCLIQMSLKFLKVLTWQIMQMEGHACHRFLSTNLAVRIEWILKFKGFECGGYLDRCSEKIV